MVPSRVRDNRVVEDLALSVAAEAGDAIVVTVTAKQAAGGPVPAKLPKIVGYVSDDSDGSSVAGTAPDTLAIQSGGLGTLTEHVANKVFTLTLDDQGVAHVEFGENGADTWYLVLVDPGSGALVISSAVTFT